MKLLITEKKDQAKKLASAMGWSEGRGCYEGNFEGDRICCVWARGHLLALKNPDEVVPGLPWDNPEALLPIPQEFPIKVGADISGAPEAAQPRTYLKNIGRFLTNDVNEIILGTDSDREGEAIGWHLIDYFGYKGRIRRAWFAAGLDKKSMSEAMQNLREPNITKSWFRASEARSRADWAFMFLVRAYSHYASYGVFGQNIGRGSGRSRVMSVGRVQTPCLGMIVRRDLEIENFVAKDHFRISGIFGKSSGFEAAYSPEVTAEIIENSPSGIEWEPSKVVPKDGEPEPLEKPLFVGKVEVDSFKQRLKGASGQAYVKKYEEGHRKKNPPKTFSLAEAQGAIAKKCKIPASVVQLILEDLYEQGWTSYARTSKSDLPMNLYEPEERNSLLGSLLRLPEISKQAQRVIDIHNGKDDVYDSFKPAVFTTKPLEHHGIVPTHEVMTESKFAALSPAKRDKKNKILHTAENMRQVYLIVVKQFIQALCPPACYSTQSALLAVPVVDLLGHEESIFKVGAEKVTDPGWTSFFSTSKEKDSAMPTLEKDQAITLGGYVRFSC